MKRIKRNIIVVLVVIGVINSLCFSAFAAETGSITIHAFDQTGNNVPVAGVQVTIYYVAELSEGGATHFVKDSQFVNFQGNLYWSNSSECLNKATELLTFITSAGIQGTTQTTSGVGYATFGDLRKGLYLVTQSGTSATYENFIPFLVELPLYENNEYNYNIHVYPKLERKPEKPVSPTPEVPVEEPKVPEAAVTPTPIPIDEPKTPAAPIPQTGMLMWPIPVMAIIGGVLLISGGITVVVSKKRGESEKDEI